MVDAGVDVGIVCVVCAVGEIVCVVVCGGVFVVGVDVVDVGVLACVIIVGIVDVGVLAGVFIVGIVIDVVVVDVVVVVVVVDVVVVAASDNKNTLARNRHCLYLCLFITEPLFSPCAQLLLLIPLELGQVPDVMAVLISTFPGELQSVGTLKRQGNETEGGLSWPVKQAEYAQCSQNSHISPFSPLHLEHSMAQSSHL